MERVADAEAFGSAAAGVLRLALLAEAEQAALPPRAAAPPGCKTAARWRATGTGRSTRDAGAGAPLAVFLGEMITPGSPGESVLYLFLLRSS